MNLETFEINWRAFLIPMVAVFLMVVLQHLGIHPPTLVAPKLAVPSYFDQQIAPKLSAKKNLFSVSDNHSFITPTEASAPFDEAKAYGLFEVNDHNLRVLASKNSSQELPVASLSKLMTATVALDLVNPNAKLAVLPDVTNITPTKMGLVPGQSWTVDELLHAMLLTSANDAAAEIAEGVDQKYPQPIFVQAMNAKAQNLGLKSSHFSNSEGLDGDTSSVNDLAILASYALENYPLIQTIAQQDYMYYPATEDHKQADLYNWNGLLDVYPGVKGVKIGNTDSAGYTTIVYSERGGKKLLAVLLGAPGVLERDLWTAQLLDEGFNKYNIAAANISDTQLRQKYASWKYFN